MTTAKVASTALMKTSGIGSNDSPGSHLQKTPGNLPAFPGFQVTPTDFQPIGKPTAEQWEIAGRNLRYIGSGHQWWIGGYLKSLELQRGEMASQEFDEEWGYDVKTLLNILRVYDSVPPKVRRYELSFAHHKEVAALPSAEQKRWLDLAAENGWSRSQLADEIRAARLAKTAEANPLPTDKYRVIYADPPWAYNDARMGTIAGGGAGAQYDTLTTDEICALDIKSLAASDAVLFLWATAPLLPDALKVIEEWGFEYKTNIVWDKERGFNGHYTDVRHEHLLVATRGSCVPDISELFPSVITEAKGKHSAKPLVFRGMIEAMYPVGNRIELFARGKATKGWNIWGNEAEQAA